MDDQEIVNLYWERSESAISETANKYGKFCTSIAFNILRNKEDSEECVNDTYLKTWESIPPHRPNSFSAFIGKITRNLSLNKLEYNNAAKRKPETTVMVLDEFYECASSLDEAEEFVNREAILEVFNNFLESLPKRERRVFVRRYWFFSSISEIAEEFVLSKANVKIILLRGREKLKDELKKAGVFV